MPDLPVPPELIIAVSFAVLGVSSLRGWKAFDQVVQYLHDELPDQWRAAGSPIGFMWVPEDASNWLDGVKARKLCRQSWLRAPPPWLQAQPELLAGLKRTRTATWVWYGGLLGIGAATAVLLRSGAAG